MHVADQMAIHVGFNAIERKLVRLAGMLHDVGHYPLSHDVEQVYKDMSGKIIPQGGEVTDHTLTFRDKVIQKIEGLTDPVTYDPFMRPNQNEFHHERMGEHVLNTNEHIKAYIGACEPEIDLQDVIAIITGNMERCDFSSQPRLSALIQILHSELDADRIDYMMRDALFSGASYGNVDIDLLLQTLVCAPIPNTNKYVLGVKPKGVSSAEQFLLNRYMAYTQMIHHKHTAMLGFMVRTLVEWLIIKNNERFCVGSKVKQNISLDDRFRNFTQFTDNVFFAELNNVDDQSSYTAPKHIQAIIESLKQLRAFDCVEEHVAVGRAEELSGSMKGSELYGRLCDVHACDQSLFMFEHEQITPHCPKNEFQRLIDRTLRGDKTLREEQDEDNSSAEDMWIDRMLHGITVVDGDQLCQLIDSERSMLRHIYDIHYTALRGYALT